jgi:hypothetical protein
LRDAAADLAAARREGGDFEPAAHPERDGDSRE